MLKRREFLVSKPRFDTGICKPIILHGNSLLEIYNESSFPVLMDFKPAVIALVNQNWWAWYYN